MPYWWRSLWHMSSKLSKLSTSFSLTLRDSLPSFYSPFKNSRGPWVEAWSFWCSPNVPTIWIAFGQTTLFIVRLLIVSSPIHSNLGITWLNGKKQFFLIDDSKFYNIRVELKSAYSSYEKNTLFGKTMMHTSGP